MELTAERQNAPLQGDWHIGFWSKLRFSFILASSSCSGQNYQFPLISINQLINKILFV